MIAADEGHTDVVKELLQHGANVNLSHRNALSPLNQALLRNHISTVQTLLAAGASPTGRGQFGFAPLLIASNKDKDVQLADLLISAGADPTSDLVGGATMLHFAARGGNVPLLDRLLALDMPVDLPEGGANDGITALSRAVEEQEEGAVATLLANGADPNHVMETSWSCILQAVKIGNYNIVKMLMQRGADVHVICRPEGWTALHIACREGHRLVVRLLLDKGWEVNARDADGATPLQLAKGAGHAAIVEILRNAGGV
jgi:ankyrin repeat protein